jgi:hypothetical protein
VGGHRVKHARHHRCMLWPRPVLLLLLLPLLLLLLLLLLLQLLVVVVRAPVE